MSADKQFFDLFTQIDNLIKKLTTVQIANNQLLQQNNVLLQAILNKPTILQAPQLTSLNIQEQGVSIPENVDVTPQIYYDEDADKVYLKKSTFLIASISGIFPSGAVFDSGNITMETQIKSFNQGLGIGPTTFDLIRIESIKLVGFNLLNLAGLPENLTFELFKNDKKFWLQDALPDQSEKILTDRSDNSFYLKPKDQFKQITSNKTTNSVKLYSEIVFWVYTEVEKTLINQYLVKLKELFSA